MSITVKDVADMVERVDEKLSPLTRYDGFQPYEGIYRLGDGSARVFAHFGLRPSPWR